MNGAVAASAIEAPTAWRRIDFISDLHLCEQAPTTLDAFRRYLRETPADALFILGDLFELWVGDDTRHLPFNQQCAEWLRAFAGTRPLHFIMGNRDFLIGQAMLQASGMQLLPDPTRLDAFDRTLLLSHGDALCLDDEPYQEYRREVRSPAWQATFLAQPMDERLEVVGKIRADSRLRKEAVPDLSQWADVDGPEARRWLQAAGARTLVHGHTHRPGRTDLGDGLERLTLSDWDLDSPRDRAEVLRLEAGGWQRLPIRPAP